MKPLLPSGCYDLLPPHAGREAALTQALLSAFEAHGYAQVNPPLLEYSDTLLSGRGAEMGDKIFRVMEAEAGKVMGIRADMTLQIARIAATRLADAPRPLRLSYAGQVLRMKGEGLSASRQLRQAGIELIGPSSPAADAEVIGVAARALAKLGISAFSIDINLPGITQALLAEDALSEAQRKAVHEAVAQKDTGAIGKIGLKHGEALAGLMRGAGPFGEALRALNEVALPPLLEPWMRRLGELVDAVMPLLPGQATLSLDATEARGFEYHHGISFSFFAPGAARELGRGGRYRIGGEGGEEATGLTFYVDTLRHLLPPMPQAPRVRVIGGDGDALDALQAEGYVTLLDIPGEARQECEFVWKDGVLRP